VVAVNGVRDEVGKEALGMRTRMLFLIGLCLLLAIPGGADAKLSFSVDFRQDGVPEAAWPLQAGEAVSFDIYVSAVPAPGLGAMGFKVVYDPAKLEVIRAETWVDAGNWPYPGLDGTPSLRFGTNESEKTAFVEMAGYRLPTSPAEQYGLSGDRIKLGTIRLRAKVTGESTLTLVDRAPAPSDDFVLAEPVNPTVLDGDLGTGVSLAAIVAPLPGDVDGNGVIGLADAILALKTVVRIGDARVHQNADINRDGVVGLQEAVYILQRVAGLR
jgi:hypothetical protein